VKDGRIEVLASLPGITAHRIGDEFIAGGLRPCAPQIVALSPDWVRVLRVGWQDGRLVAQIELREDGGALEEPPPPGDPAQAPQGGAEPAAEPEVGQEEPPLLLPRALPRTGALPHELRALVARLPVRQVDGRPGPGQRILRAVEAGITGRLVFNGDQRSSGPVELLRLSPTVCVVLRAQDGTGPWHCRGRAAYVGACCSPLAGTTVSRSFHSDAEAIAYFWGSGLPAELPPAWRLR
jgi:hypothetical protein